MAITMYGIPNCDTVKKARTRLEAAGTAYAFHDYKKAGADAGKLAAWAKAAGWEQVLNRSGQTFRKLPEAEREGLDEAKAIRLMLAHPSAIRRPIVEHPGGLLVGFKPEAWEAAGL
jgi:Spx/MgsR family transcriptional regulator